MIGLLCVGLGQVWGQTPKFGYTSVDYVLSLMPEMKAVEADFMAYKKQLESRLETKADEFKRKSEDLQRNYQTMNDLEKSDKQEELQMLQQSIYKFNQESQTSLEKKNKELLEPLFDKVQRAIDKVSEREGYAYVFKAESLLFAKDADDLSDLILKELGITPPPNPPKKKK